MVNFHGNTPYGQCQWGMLWAGDQAAIRDMINRMYKSYTGFESGDPNVTLAVDQDKCKFHIDQLSAHATCINTSSNKLFVEIYELVPRRDVHGDAGTWSPLAILNSQAQAADLFLTDTIITPPSSMETEDPRFTPYMCPALCMTYKILRRRKFSVHAGGKWTMNVQSNNYDVVNFVDSFNESLLYRPRKYKCLLYKIYGDLGVAEDTGSGTHAVRYMPTSYIGKIDIIKKGRVSEDSRVIYQDLHIAAQTAGNFNNSVSINQQKNEVASTYNIEVSTDG